MLSLVVWIWGIFVVVDAFVSRDTPEIGSMDGRNKWDFDFHFWQEVREFVQGIPCPIPLAPPISMLN